MININLERDYRLYRQRLTENPRAVSYCFAAGTRGAETYEVRYHNTGREIFGAVFAAPALDPRWDFRAYLPKVDRN